MKAKRQPQAEPAGTAFESFVQAIAAVPKEAVEQAEAQRIKRPSPKRKPAKRPS